MAQKYIRTEYGGTVVLSNIRKGRASIPVFGMNETYTATKVTQWYDGTPMDDSKADGSVYLKLTETGEYFRINLPNNLELFLEKDTMAQMRALSSTEILLLKMGYYKGVRLSGYYSKGDTPSPIEYYLSDTIDEDDGGSVFEVGGIKLEHDFVQGADVAYFGAKINAISNVNIQASIDYIESKGKGDVIISQNYEIAETIYSKENVNIIFRNGSKLILKEDVNGVDLNKNVILDKPFIDCSQVVMYSKSAIYASGDKRIKTRLQRTVINKPIVYNNENNPTGNGIHFWSGLISNEAISYVQVESPHVHGFEKGIYLEQDINPNAWVTGNVFTNVLLSGNKFHVYNLGSDGNVFTNIEFQPFLNFTERQIFCSGDFNSFNNAVLWDITNPVSIELTENSRYNTLNITSGGSGRSLIDNGDSNRVIFNESQYSIISRQFTSSRVYNSVVNNFLGYAEERNTITSTPTPTTYSINNAFRPTGVVRWEGVDSIGNIVVEVEFPNVVQEVDFLEVSFNPLYSAKNVKIELYNQATSAWVTWLDKMGNGSEILTTNKYQGLSTASNNIKKIRVTFSERNNSSVDRIELSYISLVTKANQGYSFIGRDAVATEGVYGLVKKSSAVATSTAPAPANTTPFEGTTLEELITDYNDLKIRFNQLSLLAREARTVSNNIILADRASGQQSTP